MRFTQLPTFVSVEILKLSLEHCLYLNNYLQPKLVTNDAYQQPWPKNFVPKDASHMTTTWPVMHKTC